MNLFQIHLSYINNYIKVHWCIRKKIISQIIPIHDTDDLKELRSEWVFTFFKKQPLGK